MVYMVLTMVVIMAMTGAMWVGTMVSPMPVIMMVTSVFLSGAVCIRLHICCALLRWLSAHKGAVPTEGFAVGISNGSFHMPKSNDGVWK